MTRVEQFHEKQGVPTVSRKSFLGGLAGLSSGIALAACGAGGGSGDFEDNELTLMGPTFGDKAGQDLLHSSIIAPFISDNPGAGVNYRHVPFDKLNETLGTAMAGGITPDLVLSGVGWVEPFAERGLFARLPESLTDQFGIHESVLEACTYQGELRGLPYQLGGELFIYHEDEFEKVGIDGPPESLDEMRSLLIELHGSVPTPVDIFSVAISHAWITFLTAHGGSMFNEDGTRLAFDDGSGEAALQYMVNLVNDGSANFDIQTADGQPSPWQRKDSAIALAHSGSWPQMSEESPDLIEEGRMGMFMTPPKDAQEPSWLLGGTLISVSETSADQAEARRLLEAMFEPKSLVEVSKYGGYFPPLEEAPKDPDLHSNRIASFMMANMDRAVPGEGGSAAWIEFRSKAEPELEAAVTGTQGVRETMDKVINLGNSVLEKSLIG